MDHVAIDLGGRESQICVRSADGKILQETRLRTHDLPKFLSGRARSCVVMETCAESFAIADAAKRLGHDVRVVAATLAPALGVGSRKTKSDRRDSQLLSEASCRMELPSVHIASMQSRERKTMLSMHDVLVTSRTAMINSIRGWMRSRLIRARSGAAESFTDRVRTALNGEIPASHIERVLVAIDAISIEIRKSEKELERVAKADETCRRLMSVPGVGPMTSIAFVASLDELDRFADAHKVESYFGLVPGEHSSSDRQQRLSITKAGPARARWLLVQSAWSARRTVPSHPMVQWSLEVEKRRGKRMAIVALARKIAGILFAIWRDSTVYDHTKGAKFVAR
jgi:transposase